MQPHQSVRSAVVGYLSHRIHDVFGPPGAARAAWNRIDPIIDHLVHRKESSAQGGRTTVTDAAVPTRWDEVVVRAGWTAYRLRRRYEEEAPPTQALLSGVVVSLLLVAHRLWIGDGMGVGAGLGATLTLAAVALPPAYRCWRIRTCTLDSPWRFLQHPAQWWPPQLPDDYAP